VPSNEKEEQKAKTEKDPELVKKPSTGASAISTTPKYPNVHKIAQNEMSPVKIPMEIKVQDKLVCFDYLLKSDTPDFVSRECVRDFKFDQKYYDIIKDKITNVLDFY